MSSSTADYYSTLPLNISPNVTTSSPLNDQPTIGLIGMGAMGKMYANRLSDAGWRKCVDCSCIERRLLSHSFRIHVCDTPDKFQSLKQDYAGRMQPSHRLVR